MLAVDSAAKRRGAAPNCGASATWVSLAQYEDELMVKRVRSKEETKSVYKGVGGTRVGRVMAPFASFIVRRVGCLEASQVQEAFALLWPLRLGGGKIEIVCLKYICK